jgi:UPF0755 protein
LAEQKLIKHPLVFRVAAKISGQESKLQAGSYKLSQAMTPEELVTTLTQGSEDIWLTILEGWRAEEVAESIEELELPDFDADEFLSQVKTNNLEGTLYPDTYLIPREFTARQIISLLTNTFEEKVAKLDQEVASSKLSLKDALILASLIERESRGLEEMRQVAGVLHNRLDLGMPLQVDATLQYVKGYDATKKNWWVPPTAADKQLVSPFNTYLNPGLPPQPIANPSIDALTAALEPADNDYLFYIHDRSGQIHLAKDLDAHNENVNRYLR